ncbi:putative DNA binding domain-containing protein [Desulfococcaceae bacterium HSG8]|nr:putative DNA binding domain-containing protein [Desulfococcaceae bacterium HSG8]
MENYNAHILVADDRSDELEVIVDWLKRYGYSQTDTASAQETKEKLASIHFDVIIADMRMEADDSGFEVVNEVNKRHITSVIILTANDSVTDCRRAHKMGVWDYISKNMPGGNVYEELHQSVQEIIANSQSRVDELAKLDESQTLEFKSTLEWDVKQGRQNTNLRSEVLETITAFLNSEEGGTLLIGVEDNGNIFGLEKDIKLLKHKTLDKFEQTLWNLINGRIGSEFTPLIRVCFEGKEGKYVCITDVKGSPRPVFLKAGNEKSFYVRVGNTTRKLDVEKAHKYIEMNF